MFIKDLFKEKNLLNCNFVNILMKANSVIKMNDLNDYEKLNIKTYQQLIGKMIYLLKFQRNEFYLSKWIKSKKVEIENRNLDTK